LGSAVLDEVLAKSIAEQIQNEVSGSGQPYMPATVSLKILSFLASFCQIAVWF
jgi:hypothetical protein